MFRSSGVNIAAVSEFGEFAVEVEVLLHYDVDGHQSVQRQIGPVVQEISYDSLDGEEAHDTIFMWSRLCLFRISAII